MEKKLVYVSPEVKEFDVECTDIICTSPTDMNNGGDI